MKVVIGIVLSVLIGATVYFRWPKKSALIVGSKPFTESYILAEILSQVVESAGETRVIRKFGLGQTGIAYEAIRNNEIDLYPEYTGTIAEILLKDPSLKQIGDIRKKVESLGLTISHPFGFNNTYALAVKGDVAKAMGLQTIGDLRNHPELIPGFSHEFLNREDGYPKIQELYRLPFRKLEGIAHTMGYEAIAENKIHLMDIYSTDAKVRKLNLTLLIDDKGAFPKYFGVVLARSDLKDRFPKSWRAIEKLGGKIDDSKMTELNSSVELDQKSFSAVAADFLTQKSNKRQQSTLNLVWDLTKEHFVLVSLSLLAAIAVGLPFGILAARIEFLKQGILVLSGTIQTIPSLALLCFMIPLFGIGLVPALIALFLYGLFPIVQGTYVGLAHVDSRLLEVANAMGLSHWQRLHRIEIPLASPQILSGIRTSAIINVGTTTLAALIGAGGYGVPILTGLALNDISTILRGAVPAAVMAFGVHGLFELLERICISKGLRKHG